MKPRNVALLALAKRLADITARLLRSDLGPCAVVLLHAVLRATIGRDGAELLAGLDAGTIDRAAVHTARELLGRASQWVFLAQHGAENCGLTRTPEARREHAQRTLDVLGRVAAENDPRVGSIVAAVLGFEPAVVLGLLRELAADPGAPHARAGAAGLGLLLRERSRVAHEAVQLMAGARRCTAPWGALPTAARFVSRRTVRGHAKSIAEDATKVTHEATQALVAEPDATAVDVFVFMSGKLQHLRVPVATA